MWNKPDIDINQSSSEKVNRCAVGYAFEEWWSAKEKVNRKWRHQYTWSSSTNHRSRKSTGCGYQPISDRETKPDGTSSSFVTGNGSHATRKQNGGQWLLKSVTNCTPILLRFSLPLIPIAFVSTSSLNRTLTVDIHLVGAVESHPSHLMNGRIGVTPVHKAMHFIYCDSSHSPAIMYYGS